MPRVGHSEGGVARISPARKEKDRRHNVLVALNDEQMAAAEGWRSAHGIPDQAEALGELIRLGLLSEIAKIYRLVSDGRTARRGANEDAYGETPVSN